MSQEKRSQLALTISTFLKVRPTAHGNTMMAFTSLDTVVVVVLFCLFVCLFVVLFCLLFCLCVFWFWGFFVCLSVWFGLVFICLFACYVVGFRKLFTNQQITYVHCQHW